MAEKKKQLLRLLGNWPKKKKSTKPLKGVSIRS